MLRAVVLLLSLASVGAQFVPVQLPFIAPSLDDEPVIALPPSPEIAVDPVPAVGDEPVQSVPIPGVTAPEKPDVSPDEESDDAVDEPAVSTSDGEIPKRTLIRRADSDDVDDGSRGPFRRGRKLGHDLHRGGPKRPVKKSNRRNRRRSDDDDDARRPRRRRPHGHGHPHRHGSGSSDDDDDGTPTTSTDINPGDLSDLVGLPCADSYSEGKCKYLAAQGLCSSTVSWHVVKSWRRCRQTCNLCEAEVPNCAPGYRYNEALQQCVDIDECAEKSATCAANAQCVNKGGSYSCRCKEGYRGNGMKSCQVHIADVSVNCAKYSAQCQVPAARIFLSKLCPVTCGIVDKARCSTGFKVSEDGRTCVNVNECLANTAKCPARSTCVDTNGSYKCACNFGYSFNIFTQTCEEYCKDVRTDCASRVSQCNAGTSLQQAWMGTHCPATCRTCGKTRCARGYQLNADGQCVDVDECSSSDLNNCAANAKCTNTVGSYTCRCQDGYKGNGFVKCTTRSCFDLHHRYQCDAMKTQGICSSRERYQCAQTCRICSDDDAASCSKGYAARNDVCLDVDECKALTHRCPSNSRCLNAYGGYRCQCNQGYSPTRATGEWKCVRENTCYIAGDPHIRTFDGQFLENRGTCRYTLAQPDAKKRGLLTDFTVVIVTEHRNGDPKTTWVGSVEVYAFGVLVYLGRDGLVLVNGERKAVPYSPRPGLTITRSARDVTVTLGSGVRVSYDGVQQAKVAVPDSYRRKMTGLCGNLDDIPANDLVTKEGLRTPSYPKIVNSWAIPDPTRPCRPVTDDDVTQDCSKEDRRRISGKGQCGILKDLKGPFADCNKKIDPSMTYDLCVTDLCKSASNPQTLCRSLQTYADRCQAEGVTVAWRSPTLCPLACDESSVYSPSMSACPASCANPSSEGTCTSLPHEGCACNAGMVRDGNQKCIPVAQCGCQLNGVYHSTGDVWYAEDCSYRFTCMEQSTILKVPSTCQDTGTCQTKNGKVGCYCNDPASGTLCDVDSGYPQVTPNDPGYDPTAPILPPVVVQPTTTTPAPTPPTTPAYIPPHPDGEIADDEYFNAPPPPPPPPKARPLGVESGVIPDKDLTASSSTPTDPPSKMRPNSRGGWTPDPSDKSPYATMDLGRPMEVHGVGTLGHYSKPCWVTNYNIEVSNDGVNYTPLLDTRPEYSTQPRNFLGNTDQNTWKKHCLHQYYGAPVTTRYLRFKPLANNGCMGFRGEMYGFRDGKDPKQVEVLQQDQWTKTTEGCQCYFDNSTSECACCNPGGCQCPRSNLHQCVQCGYADKCGTPEIKAADEQADPWTLTPTGCQCLWDQTRFDCACCQDLACQCGQENKNQCVACGHQEHCGMKEEVFGPNETCVPKTCPSSDSESVSDSDFEE